MSLRSTQLADLKKELQPVIGQRLWIISRIKDDITRKQLAIEDDDMWDQKCFFDNEAKAHQDYLWMKDHNGGMREYMLVADTTPRKKSVILNGMEFVDPLDDELPWYC